MNNGWTKENCDEIFTWISTCEKYKNAHKLKKKYYKKRTTLLLFFSVMASMISSAVNIIISIKYIQIISIIGAIIGAISGTLGIYYRKHEIQKKITKHSETSKEYSHIISQIKYQLEIDELYRPNCTDFMKEIMDRMITLESGEKSTPIMPKNDYQKYKKEFISKSNKNITENVNLDKKEEQSDKKEEELKENFAIYFKEFPNKNKDIMFNHQVTEFQLNRLNNN